MKHKRNIKGLCKALAYYKDSNVRKCAAEALGDIGDTHAVDALTVVLTDRFLDVRNAAVDALIRIDKVRAVDGLVGVLKNQDIDMRSWAMKTLEKINDNYTVDALIVALKDQNKYVRWEVVDILGDIGARWGAAWAPEEVVNERAVDALIDTALKDPESNVQNAAVKALERIDKVLAVEKLVEVLKNQDPHLRLGAMNVLGKIGIARAADALLIVALKDPESYMRKSATETLETIGDDYAVDALVKIGKVDGVDGLVAILKNHESNLREWAAEALGKIGDARALDTLLIVALKDPESYVRNAAVKALDKIGDARAVDTLIIVSLKDKDPSVRWWAAEALGKIGDARAVDALIVALKDQDEYVRQGAVAALTRIDKVRGVDGLVAILKNHESNLREWAAEALGKIGDARAVDTLIITLKDGESSVRNTAAEALGKIGDARAVDALIVALQDRDPFVRNTTLEALEKIDDDRAVEVLIAERQSSYSIRDLSMNAVDLISEALKIIEKQVTLERDIYLVTGSGDVGPLMDAANKLEAAYKLHPQIPFVQYAYALCLFIAMQFKSGKAVMEDCARSHPNFPLAQYALKSWNCAEWRPLFLLPQWGPNSQNLFILSWPDISLARFIDSRLKIPSVISQTVETQIVLPVREGIRPRAAFFFRDTQDTLRVTTLQNVPIELAAIISPVHDPQVVGVCAKIHDNPGSPLIVEAFHVPFFPHGHSARCAFEYLCLQEDMDVVVIDSQDRILLNKRVPFSMRMKKTLMKIQTMLNSSEGRIASQMEIARAIQDHQRQVSLSDYQF